MIIFLLLKVLLGNFSGFIDLLDNIIINLLFPIIFILNIFSIFIKIHKTIYIIIIWTRIPLSLLLILEIWMSFLLIVSWVRIIFINRKLFIFCIIYIIIVLYSLVLASSSSFIYITWLIYFFIILIYQISLILYSIALLESSNVFHIILIIIEKSLIILILVRKTHSSVKLSRHCLILLFLLHLFEIILFLTTLHIILIYFLRHEIFTCNCME